MAASISVRGGSTDVDVVGGSIVGGTIAGRSIGSRAMRTDRVIDATGCSVVPGFVDVQINGGFGIDLTGEPERIDELAAILPRTGVTAFAPTVVTAPPEVRARAVEVLTTRGARAAGAARSVGVHLEGPYLNPQRKGAHPERHLRAPSQAEVVGWSAAGGVAMVTLAPELTGALDLVRELTSRGVVVSAGHTSASAGDLARGVAAGITGATHLYNAMGSFGSRDPATVGALLAHPSLICGLIVDGVHVDPLMVVVAWRALGPAQIALVTDAIAALGSGPGTYGIGRIEVSVDGTSARTAGGVLAGSILRMDQAVRNLVAFTGCSLADASVSASTTPARLLRRADLGRLDEGCAGDIVLLDEGLEVAATIVGGEVAHDRDGRAAA